MSAVPSIFPGVPSAETPAFAQLLAPRYITLAKFEELTGYSVDAVNSKIKRGQWLESQVWIKAPDGRILIDLIGYATWVKGEMACPPPPRRR